MSREIKFRAWDKGTNEWMFGYNLPNLGGFSMFGEVMVMNEWSSAAWADVQGKRDIELMQYTGLKDKNGVEIYEGDIITELGMVKEVKWTSEYLGWVFIPRQEYHNYSAHIEVIGNIYENPELLGAKDETN